MSFQGTELSFAYGPLTGGGGGNEAGSMLYESIASHDQEPQEMIKKQEAPKPVVQSTKMPIMPQQQLYDAKTINNQYEQEQKLMNILSEIKKQQKTVVSSQDNQSYIDKLYAKRKELWKALQIAFIIILAMSVHFLIDHYLKLYISNTDLSFERELFIRLLYPLAIVFLLWNLKTFVR